MKDMWRRLIANWKLRSDLYYVYRVENTGRERFLFTSDHNVWHRFYTYTVYSLTQREAYIKRKISLRGV